MPFHTDAINTVMSDDQFWRASPAAQDLMRVFAARGHYSSSLDLDATEGIEVWRDNFRYTHRGVAVEVARAVPVASSGRGSPPPLTKSACVWQAVHKFLLLFALQRV